MPEPDYYKGDISRSREKTKTSPFNRTNYTSRYVGDVMKPAFPEIEDKGVGDIDVTQAGAYEHLQGPGTLLGKRNQRYLADNTSYSGADIRAIAHVGDKYEVFGNLQTLSYSLHREKTPVRTLGISYPKGYVRGPRTLAGSLVFTVFDRHVLFELMQFYQKDRPDQITHLPLADMMPPFDITISFVNEYGHQSVMRLYGVELIDEGQTMSIDDMITENTMSYLARNIEIMVSDEYKSLAGREGDVVFNRGIFSAFKGIDEATLNRQQKLLNRLAELQTRLARDIPVLLESTDTTISATAALEQNDIAQEIERIKTILESGTLGSLYVAARTSQSGTEFYSLPWDYRNIRHERPNIDEPYSPSRSIATKL